MRFARSNAGLPAKQRAPLHVHDNALVIEQKYNGILNLEQSARNADRANIADTARKCAVKCTSHAPVCEPTHSHQAFETPSGPLRGSKPARVDQARAARARAVVRVHSPVVRLAAAEQAACALRFTQGLALGASAATCAHEPGRTILLLRPRP